jgi:HlyD family secretion protein
LSGYAEAELVYLASSSAGTLQTLNVKRGDASRPARSLYATGQRRRSPVRDAAQARSERALAQADNLRKGKRPLELAALDEQLAQARPRWPARPPRWRASRRWCSRATCRRCGWKS